VTFGSVRVVSRRFSKTNHRKSELHFKLSPRLRSKESPSRPSGRNMRWRSPQVLCFWLFGSFKRKGATRPVRYVSCVYVCVFGDSPRDPCRLSRKEAVFTVANRLNPHKLDRNKSCRPTSSVAFLCQNRLYLNVTSQTEVTMIQSEQSKSRYDETTA
jgi:hypothetical protein